MKHIKKITALILTAVMLSLPIVVHADMNLFELTMKEAVDKQTVKMTIFRFMTEYESLKNKGADILDRACNTKVFERGEKDALLAEMDELIKEMRRMYIKSSDIVSLIKMYQISQAAFNISSYDESVMLAEDIAQIRDQIHSDGITVEAIKMALEDESIDFNLLKTVISEKNTLEAEKSILVKELSTLNLRISITSAKIDEMNAYADYKRYIFENPVVEEEVPEEETEYVPTEEVEEVITPIVITVAEEEMESMSELEAALVNYTASWNEKNQRLNELTGLIDNANKKINAVLNGEVLPETETIDSEEESEEDATPEGFIEIPEEIAIEPNEDGEYVIPIRPTPSDQVDTPSAEDTPSLDNTPSIEDIPSVAEEIITEESEEPEESFTFTTVSEAPTQTEEPKEDNASLIKSLPTDYIIYGAAGLGGIIILAVIIIVLKKKKKNKGVEMLESEVEEVDDDSDDDSDNESDDDSNESEDVPEPSPDTSDDDESFEDDFDVDSEDLV